MLAARGSIQQIARPRSGSNDVRRGSRGGGRRAPLSSIDQLITDWRAQGGDQTRAEFEEAIAGATA
jgi:hypothetical protein